MTLTLVLNIWLPAWASALIVVVVLLSGGLAAGIADMRKTGWEITKARVDMNRVKEDVR
ncbi:MAG: hypothetical protein GXY28_12590 [Bacteriovoracaceae bacterium]|nr:hypothetical protein [Bacteriovoracaceae bacterium]HRR22039.1 hypothetical protein [Desulfomonilia bacterium]HRR69794.1 hypothetical protein [Desulfomonilia bacterium]HRT44962.1 hypothetical protein [Desulfomonilia bacterium]